MLEFIEKQKNKWYLWFSEKAKGKHAIRTLALISFTESIIFPTTLFSILGGLVGYVIGLFFFDTIGTKIVDFYSLQAELAEAKTLYNDNAFIVTLIGAFTPIPYKIFVLTAGFLKTNILAFLSASVIGRGLQFFLVAFVMKKYGDKATQLFLKYFNYLAIIGILGLLYIFLH
jgi:membrane protein YqaA with SNARE-associated domain